MKKTRILSCLYFACFFQKTKSERSSGCKCNSLLSLQYLYLILFYFFVWKIYFRSNFKVFKTISYAFSSYLSKCCCYKNKKNHYSLYISQFYYNPHISIILCFPDCNSYKDIRSDVYVQVFNPLCSFILLMIEFIWSDACSSSPLTE